MKAWIIVNKDFSRLQKINPSLVAGDVFFTKEQAVNDLESRYPKFCKECGRKNKKPIERHVEIREIEMLIS